MSTTTRHATTGAAPDWTYALCAQTDPALFFPEGVGARIVQLTEQAKRICDRCPIRSACLEWAVETGQTAGVWGGLDEKERRVMLRLRTDRSDAYERCIAEQEYIEQRAAQGASHRLIGDELGVGHSTVGKAWRFFEAERESERAAAAAKEVQAV